MQGLAHIQVRCGSHFTHGLNLNVSVRTEVEEGEQGHKNMEKRRVRVAGPDTAGQEQLSEDCAMVKGVAPPVLLWQVNPYSEMAASAQFSLAKLNVQNVYS